MRPVLASTTLCLLLSSTALARPAQRPSIPAPLPARASEGLVGTPLGLAVAPGDTVTFGGTAWDPVDMRWEALRDSVWTFESGVASAINTDPDLKAVGLHSLMEGWVGLDFAAPAGGEFFRRSSQCAIDGTWSLWAGVTATEADSLGYAAGQGYGNNWRMGAGKSFLYPGTGDVTLRYAYAVESEESFDFLIVLADTTGNLSAPPVEIRSYEGTAAGTDSLVLTPGSSLPSAPGSITLIFLAQSDAAWSDEDGEGGFDSMCGHSALDDIVLTGAITDTSDFEAGDQGWSFIEVPLEDPGGDWSDIRAVADLDIDPAICTGTFGDSALVFFDPGIGGGGHGRSQNNVAVSPWIDLRAPDLAQKVARVLEYTYYGDVPFLDLVALTFYARWLPSDLASPTGQGDGTELHSVTTLLPVQGCATRPEFTRIELTGHVPPGAEQLQVAVGVFNFCNFYSGCTGQSNQSPWFDDIRLAVFEGPIVQRLRSNQDDLPRDAFPELDTGTDLAHMTARFDSNRLREGALGDTLVVRTDQVYNGSRVDVVFRVTGGPGIDGTRLATWLSGFADEGDGWVSARMDTAEVDGVVVLGRWMTAFHEEDPNFRLSDTTLDPNDRFPYTGGLERLANDIFPDDLFTPGTRVDLFYRWTLPAYPGQMSLLPDTTGATYLEMEVLPSSLSLQGPEPVNNRILFVNQSRDGDVRETVEAALAVLRPGTSANAEGTAWDRFDIPNAGSMIPGTVVYSWAEHEARFLDRYDVILWQFDAIPVQSLLFDSRPDAIRLTEWLDCAQGGPGGNNGCGRALYLAGQSFYHTTGDFYRSLGAETLDQLGSRDPCIEVTGKPVGAHFGGNTSWALDGHDLADQLLPRVSQGDADHQVNLLYQTDQFPDVEAASMSTVQLVRTNGAVTGYWRSVFDGFPITYLTDTTECTTAVGAAAERLGDVLAWFEEPGPTPVDLLSVTVARDPEGVLLRWRVADGRGDLAGFHVYREVPGLDRERLNPTLLTAREEFVYRDTEAPAGRVEYWLLELSRDGTSTWHGPFLPEASPVPLRFRVLPVHPNPFAASARIRLELPVETPVEGRVFSLDGRLVATLHQGPLPAGRHDLVWDGRDAGGRTAAAGIYFTVIRTPDHRVVRKMVKVDGR